MKKMMLLASMVAFAVMMLAAAPAFAQTDRVLVCHKVMERETRASP
jgi:ABC-type sugar transport system substrate-binding protein